MRYQVMSYQEAKDAGVEDKYLDWDDLIEDEVNGYGGGGVLVDTIRGAVVYMDGGEPEDMYLIRNLRMFVDELNRLAEEKTATTTWEGK